MRGCEVLTADDRTQVTWVVGPSPDALKAPVHRVGAGIGERADTLRARLIAATVELAAEGSNPRLQQSRHAPIAP